MNIALRRASRARYEARHRAARRVRSRVYWSRRQVFAKWLHTGLVEVLGGACEVCGLREGEPNEEGIATRLEVDHQFGREWRLERFNPLTRVLRYWEEHLSKVKLRVLCKADNSNYRPPWMTPEQSEPEPVYDDEVPF